jgi:hypothetical protein
MARGADASSISSLANLKGDKKKRLSLAEQVVQECVLNDACVLVKSTRIQLSASVLL